MITGILIFLAWLFLWVIVSVVISKKTRSKIISIGGGFVISLVIFTIAISVFNTIKKRKVLKVAQEAGFTTTARQSEPVVEESYKNWPPYKDYLRLSDGYKSPAMEKSYKDSYEAEKIVKNLPCSKGGTLDQYFSKKPKPPVEDLGWDEFPVENGVDVVRTFLLNPSGSLETLEYRWHVDSKGKAKPINGKAIGITK